MRWPPVMGGEIYNPYTTRAVTAGQVDPTTGLVAKSTGNVRDPFAGNIIPTSMLSPAVEAYAHIWYPSVTTGGVNNLVNTEPSTLNQYQYNTRFDYNFTSNLRFFALSSVLAPPAIHESGSVVETASAPYSAPEALHYPRCIGASKVAVV